MAGWIKLHRDLASHWLWEEEPFSRGQAWIDLLLWARHSPGKVPIDGKPVSVGVGQQARSEVTLAKSWGWSRGKVRRFLKTLEGDGMIVQQTNNRTSIITICNYRQFQEDGGAARTSVGTADEHQSVQQTNISRYTIEEGGKNGDKGENNPSVASGDATKGYPSDFEELWKTYPKRKGNSKKAAHKAWAARIKAGASPDELLTGVKAYAAYCEHNGKTATEFVKHAKTFLGPDEHYLADWSVSDCPHADIVAAWNDEMPAHILRTAPDAWSPGSSGRDRLEVTWSILKTKMRKDETGYVVQNPEQGAEWFRGVFRRLAKSPRLQDEASGQWCKLSWAVKNETIHDIAEGGYDQ